MSQVVRVSLSYVYTVSSFKYVYFQKLQRTVSSKEKVPLFANVHLRKSLSTKYRTTNVLVAPKSKKTELVRSFQVSFIITSLTSHQTNSHGTEFLHQCIGDSRVVFPNGCFQPTHLGEGSMEISMGDFDGELRQSSNKLLCFCHIDEDFSCEACRQNSGNNTFSIKSVIIK